MNRSHVTVQTRRFQANSTLRIAAACAGLLSILIPASVAAAETSAQGTLTHAYNEDLVEQFGPELVLEFTDGVAIDFI